MITLFATKLSAHGQRVEMLLKALDLEFAYQHVTREERSGSAFLALNPLGQIPILQDGNVTIADSNAILVYLAMRYDRENVWLPRTPEALASVQRWLSIAAGEIAHGLALARAIQQFGAENNLEEAQARSVRILEAMEIHLSNRLWLADEPGSETGRIGPTIADMACCGYVSTAAEAGIPLNPYVNVRGWLFRMEQQPFFEPIPPANSIVSRQLHC